ncbi:MAG: 4-(cytidine 5'-diphospho)-2-C-methyl-D-erythritol kinase, partial [Candidatus Fonsibacter sp.]
GGLSTPAVYAECDRLRAGRTVPSPYVSDMLMQALRAGDAVLVGKSLRHVGADWMTLRSLKRTMSWPHP